MKSALAKSCSLAVILAALVFVGGCNRSGTSSSTQVQGVATASSIAVVTATNAD